MSDNNHDIELDDDQVWIGNKCGSATLQIGSVSGVYKINFVNGPEKSFEGQIQVRNSPQTSPNTSIMSFFVEDGAPEVMKLDQNGIHTERQLKTEGAITTNASIHAEKLIQTNDYVKAVKGIESEGGVTVKGKITTNADIYAHRNIRAGANFIGGGQLELDGRPVRGYVRIVDTGTPPVPMPSTGSVRSSPAGFEETEASPGDIEEEEPKHFGEGSRRALVHDVEAKSLVINREVDYKGGVSIESKAEIYAPKATLRLHAISDNEFGSSRLEFWSDPKGDGAWRPAFIKSWDRGNYTGQLKFFVNGSKFEHKRSELEVMCIDDIGVHVHGTDLKLDGGKERRKQTVQATLPGGMPASTSVANLEGERRALVHDLEDILTLNYLSDYTGGVRINGDVRIDKVLGNMTVQGTDLLLDGGSHRRERRVKVTMPGGREFEKVEENKDGSRRALVHDGGDILTLNYLSDYTGGVRINGDVRIDKVLGNMTVQGTDLLLDGGNTRRERRVKMVNPSGLESEKVFENKDGSRRALAHDGGDILTLNYANDYTGGVSIQSSAEVYAPDATLRLHAVSDGKFGSSRLEFWSDRKEAEPWRPAFIQSWDRGDWTGQLKFFVNGSGGDNRKKAVEVMCLEKSQVDIKGKMVVQEGVDVTGPMIAHGEVNIKQKLTADGSIQVGPTRIHAFNPYGKGSFGTRPEPGGLMVKLREKDSQQREQVVAITPGGIEFWAIEKVGDKEQIVSSFDVLDELQKVKKEVEDLKRWLRRILGEHPDRGNA